MRWLPVALLLSSCAWSPGPTPECRHGELIQETTFWERSVELTIVLDTTTLPTETAAPRLRSLVHEMIGAYGLDRLRVGVVAPDGSLVGGCDRTVSWIEWRAATDGAPEPALDALECRLRAAPRGWDPVGALTRLRAARPSGRRPIHLLVTAGDLDPEGFSALLPSLRADGAELALLAGFDEDHRARGCSGAIDAEPAPGVDALAEAADGVIRVSLGSICADPWILPHHFPTSGVPVRCLARRPLSDGDRPRCTVIETRLDEVACDDYPSRVRLDRDDPTTCEVRGLELVPLGFDCSGTAAELGYSPPSAPVHVEIRCQTDLSEPETCE